MHDKHFRTNLHIVALCAMMTTVNMETNQNILPNNCCQATKAAAYH